MSRPRVMPADSLLPFPVASVVSNHQLLWLRKCPACGKRKPMLAKVKTCSHQCAGVMTSLSPGRQHRLRKRLPRMMRLAAEARRRNVEQRAAEIVQGLSLVDAYLLGRREGYQVGWKVGRRLKEEADLDAWEMDLAAAGATAPAARRCGQRPAEAAAVSV